MKYNENLQQVGGVLGNKVKTINDILNKFKKYNIKIDLVESKSDDFRIELFSIYNKIICFSVLINLVDKVATIENLLFDRYCLSNLDPKEITPKIIKIIKEITPKIIKIIKEICRHSGIKKNITYRQCSILL